MKIGARVRNVVIARVIQCLTYVMVICVAGAVANWTLRSRSVFLELGHRLVRLWVEWELE